MTSPNARRLLALDVRITELSIAINRTSPTQYPNEYALLARALAYALREKRRLLTNPPDGDKTDALELTHADTDESNDIVH